jgi:hypothetical protein
MGIRMQSNLRSQLCFFRHSEEQRVHCQFYYSTAVNHRNVLLSDVCGFRSRVRAFLFEDYSTSFYPLGAEFVSVLVSR